MNINHYTYRVTWSAEDNEHVGLCTEFLNAMQYVSMHSPNMRGFVCSHKEYSEESVLKNLIRKSLFK
jgi:hypothetical protein